MANPWGTAGMAAGVAVLLAILGPLLNSSIAWRMGRFFADRSFDAPRKLRELEFETIPDLKKTLRDVVEQRIVRAEDEGSKSDLRPLDNLATCLRSALYQAEDILDLIHYHRIEEERAISDKWSWFWRFIDFSRAMLLLCEPIFNRLGRFVGKILRRPSSELPISNATSHSTPQNISGRSRHHSNWYQPILKWLGSAIKAILKWLGSAIKAPYFWFLNMKMDISDAINLRKRIEDVQNIANDSKKSPLLNRQSCSSEIPMKDTNMKGSSRHEEKKINYERKVIGRNEDLKLICRKLREGQDTISVIGIHGIPGSGKTTLARYVCEYEKREGNHFDLIMFIHVSTRFTVDDIFSDMLDQMEQNIDPTSAVRDRNNLQQKFTETLSGRRFLLVLDDLSVNNRNDQVELLDTLLNALKVEKSKSRILVTAKEKGAYAQEQILIRKLNEEEYLELFMHYALQDNVDGDGKFLSIGRKIANKLHRSPIAAVTVAKRLNKNNNICDWERTANLDLLNNTIKTLWWSYDQLGADIKRCFEFCIIFPRGYKLQRDRLVRMWIAQGFVETSNASEELEEVGQSYFNELLKFSFLEELPRTGLATEHFIIHDMLHELVERIAGNDFFRIDVNDSPEDIRPDVHHLYIGTYERAKIKDKHLKLDNLRTLIIEEKFPSNLDTNPKYLLPSNEPNSEERHDLAKEEVFLGMFKRLRKLRVLIVEVNCSEVLVFSVPSSIGKMKHLRYLGFRVINKLEMIFPSTFSKLYHLQILDCPYVELSCPANMTNLIHLRHISGHLDFPNIGKLTELQTLPSPASFQVRGEEGYELKQLKHLNKLRGTLEIYGLGIVGSNEEALEANLACKKGLTELTLDFRSHKFDPNVEADVLEGLCPPVHLEKLRIWNYRGSRYPGWMLSREHRDGPNDLNLNLLEFCGCSRLVSIPDDSQIFRCLRSLEITDCVWDSLPENMAHLESLHTLIITYCNNIQLLPDLPQSLQRIQIIGELSKSCKEIGHINWQKVRNISTKEFY